MAVSAPVGAGSAQSAVSASTLAITAGTIPLNALIVVGARFNTSQTIASCSITDSAGNSYVVRNAANGNEIFGDAINVTDVSAGTITVNGSTAATARIAVCFYMTGVDTANRFGAIIGQVPFFQGTARNVSGSTVTPVVGACVCGLWSLDTTETSFVGTSGYTAGPTWTGTGYYTANSLSLEMAYLIATSAAATQPTGTGGASPSAYGAAAIWYRPSVDLIPRPVVVDTAVSRASNY